MLLPMGKLEHFMVVAGLAPAGALGRVPVKGCLIDKLAFPKKHLINWPLGKACSCNSVAAE